MQAGMKTCIKDEKPFGEYLLGDRKLIAQGSKTMIVIVVMVVTVTMMAMITAGMGWNSFGYGYMIGRKFYCSYNLVRKLILAVERCRWIRRIDNDDAWWWCRQLPNWEAQLPQTSESQTREMCPEIDVFAFPFWWCSDTPAISKAMLSKASMVTLQLIISERKHDRMKSRRMPSVLSIILCCSMVCFTQYTCGAEEIFFRLQACWSCGRNRAGMLTW